MFFQQGATIGIDDEDDSTFTITVDQKMFHFQGTHSFLVGFPLTLNYWFSDFRHCRKAEQGKTLHFNPLDPAH